MGSGIIEGNRAGGSVKRMHCGWAAHAGIVAAQMAAAGFTGPGVGARGAVRVLPGVLRRRVRRPRSSPTGLGDAWCLPGIFYKPYPANHFTHAGIDAAIRLRARSSAWRTSRTSNWASRRRRCGRSASRPTLKARPQSGYHAQFSGPFTVAAALLGGGGLGLALDDFTDEHVRDPRYLDLAAKVRVVGQRRLRRHLPEPVPGASCAYARATAACTRRG